MGHEFDTGAVLPQRRRIREAIAARVREDLEIASSPLSQGPRYLRGVVEIPAPFSQGDGDLELMLEEALAGRSPCVAIALGDRDFAANNTDVRSWTGDLSVHVYVISSHRGGMLTRMRGGDIGAEFDQTLDPGLETILEHVLERLAGFSLSDYGATELRPVSESLSYFATDYTICEIRFRTQVFTTVNPHRKRVRLLTDIYATHEDETAAPTDVQARTELDPPE